HHAQHDSGFALQGGARSTRRKSQDLPWPQRRQHPFHHIASRMAVADDLAFAVYVKAGHGNDLGSQRYIGGRQTDAVKGELEVAFAHEVTWFLVGLEMPNHICATGENRLAELLHVARIAEKWIPHVDRGRRELGFIQCACHQRSRWDYDLAGLSRLPPTQAAQRDREIK